MARTSVSYGSGGAGYHASATYLDSSKVAITGEAAVSTYIRDNTGRTVELVPRLLALEVNFLDQKMVKR